MEFIYVAQELTTMLVQRPVNYSVTLGDCLRVEMENRIMYVPSKSYTAEDVVHSSLKAEPRQRAAA